MAPAPQQESPHGISRTLTYCMALGTGIAVANNYYNQPLLGLIERDLPGTASALVPTVTQLGYATGLVLLVPLGDVIDRRLLTIIQFLLLAVSLAAAALAPTGLALVAASLVMGMLSTAAQHIVPFAAELATPEKRGQVLGIVISGGISGVLLSRTFAGFVGAHYGWRTMFWIGVPLALFAMVLMVFKMPRGRTSSGGVRYGRLLASIAHLWRDLPELRIAAMTQALIYAAFSCFWTILALHLQEPAIGLGPEVAGTFGLVGLVGLMVTPIAGRISDSRGPFQLVLIGAGLTVVSWLVMGLAGTLVGLVIGVIILDLAARGAVVANQHIVFSLNPEARSRLNTLFMGSMFAGGAFGSATAMAAWKLSGWTAVSALGIGFAALATLVQVIHHRRRRRVAA